MIIGLKDTAGEEISFLGIVQGKGSFPNPTLAKAIAVLELETERPRNGKIGVSELLDEPRRRALASSHDVFVTVDSMIARAIGSVYHKWLATVDNGAVNELEVKAIIQGTELIGHIDLYDEKQRLIADNKTASSFQFKNKLEEYRPQLYCYQWLAEVNGLLVEKIELRFWIKDTSLSKTWQPPLTPVVDVPLGNLDEIEVDINQRIGVSLATKDLPDEELPMCVDKWVNKDGKALRCEYYCDYADICKNIEAAKQPFDHEAAHRAIIDEAAKYVTDEAAKWLEGICPGGLPADRDACVALFVKARALKDLL